MSTRVSLWKNDRKTEAKHPDAKGQIEITLAVLQELVTLWQRGEGITQNYQGEQCFRLDAAAWWGNQQNPQAPIVSINISSYAETQDRAAKVAAWKAQQNGGAAPAVPGGWQPPAVPQAAPQPPAAAPAPPVAPAPVAAAPPMAAPPAAVPAIPAFQVPQGF